MCKVLVIILMLSFSSGLFAADSDSVTIEGSSISDGSDVDESEDAVETGASSRNDNKNLMRLAVGTLGVCCVVVGAIIIVANKISSNWYETRTIV